MTDEAESDRPTSAGMYDYYLGGTANTAADRAAGARVKELLPDTVDAIWANRGFLQRAVARMAGERGIRQFIDLGAGLPTQRNTHEVAAEVAADVRVVYSDLDPAVIARGREILAGVAGTAVVQADFRTPEAVLDHPETRRLINFDQPVGLLMVAVLHFVPDADDPWGIVARYLDAVAPGSHLALSAATADHQPRHVMDAIIKIYASSSTPLTDRTKTEVERFFTGLEIMPPYEGASPALCFAGQWGAEDAQAADSDGSRWVYAAVARKP